MFTMRKFRNLEFEFKNTEKFGGINNRSERISKYIDIEKSIKDKEDFSQGVEMSFNPDILNSIKTSLINSEIYKSKEKLPHKIFNALLFKPLNYKDLTEIIGNDINLENSLKSLISAGIIKKKEGMFKVNNYLK
ncbi:hypothetical protein HERIO_707 [Hepatospora eriocheir]|uniref:Uncharacterized protein n=1 Tax=Hepatospora eriocheir TaxID=1081669 RepID=A0A1X0QCC3_9MICR|nr:hypothetical protein HERIO_707 [Hepatospora eriocheir]